VGIILDSSIIIAAERRGHTVREILEQVKARIASLSADGRDVFRYMVQFGEREQQVIFADAGMNDNEFVVHKITTFHSFKVFHLRSPH